jgi:hypothetical protein
MAPLYTHTSEISLKISLYRTIALPPIHFNDKCILLLLILIFYIIPFLTHTTHQNPSQNDLSDNTENTRRLMPITGERDCRFLLRWPVPPNPTLGYWLLPTNEPETLVGTTMDIWVVVMPGCGAWGGAGVGYLLQSGTRQQASLGSVTSRQLLGRLLNVLHLLVKIQDHLQSNITEPQNI